MREVENGVQKKKKREVENGVGERERGGGIHNFTWWPQETRHVYYSTLAEPSHSHLIHIATHSLLGESDTNHPFPLRGVPLARDYLSACCTAPLPERGNKYRSWDPVAFSVSLRSNISRPLRTEKCFFTIVELAWRIFTVC